MADQRKGGIGWTDETWNPVRGCSRISEGCRNCYAEAVAARFSGLAPDGRPLAYHGLARMTPSGPRWTGALRLVPERLEDPVRWQRPRMVFVNSMSDLFHESLGFDVVQAVFDVIFRAPRHTYQILTKRAKRMAEVLRFVRTPTGLKWEDGPSKNVWIGVSAEDQANAEERVPRLLETPAALRFLSVEPLLGPVDLSPWLGPAQLARGVRPGVDWVIVGAESGPDARPMDLDWARAVRDQCARAGVPFFLKQAVVDGRLVKEPELDGRRWTELPGTKAA